MEQTLQSCRQLGNFQRQQNQSSFGPSSQCRLSTSYSALRSMTFAFQRSLFRSFHPVRIAAACVAALGIAVCSLAVADRQDQPALSTDSAPLVIKANAGEFWWLGITSQGHRQPLGAEFQANIVANTYGNQVQPLLLSSGGRGVWSERGFQVHWKEGALTIDQNGAKVVQFQAGDSLRSAYLDAAAHFFPPSGVLPEEMLFSRPQYNTWIELMYDQNQEDILRYARGIVEQGFPPGVLMIDDNWQEDYGKWSFHPARFSDPQAMVGELHRLGFKVMLWICPFVSPDCDVYRELRAKGAFLREQAAADKQGPPKMIRWWNGVSAVLDLSNPAAKSWFKGRLDNLQDEYGIDGFKLDAGDSHYYANGVSFGGVSANEQSRLFGEVGLDYPLNEYRAMWQMGGQPLVQRLRDKNHSWQDLQKLIPQMALTGLLGYPFSCPDMIGGGDYKSFLSTKALNQQLIVRSAQCHALMPMMQFSVAPWRILDQHHLEAVKQAVALRGEFEALILSVARSSAKSGEPILRPLEYDYPHQGYATVQDQFLIGRDLLVAPVVTPNARERQVKIPPGKWQSFRGETIDGPKTLTIAVALEDLPHYKRIKN